MDIMWKKLKEYFPDGFIPGSSPLSFDIHWCDRRPPSTRITTHDGIEIEEAAMPLFTTLGDTCKPSCICENIIHIREHIDKYMQTAPETHPADYSLHSGKNDKSVQEASVYSLRDALQWWSLWHGQGGLILERHRWKILYVALAGLLDDVAIPPHHLSNGSFRFLGHSLGTILDGLREEGVHPEEIKDAEMCMLLGAIVQYLEKWRVFTGNTRGVGVLLLAARGARSHDVGVTALEMAGTCQLTALDITKEAMGILQGEKTETVAGDREQRQRELRWIHIRCLDCFNSQENALFLRRYAASGFFFPILMDRYHERVENVRFPLLPGVESVVSSYMALNA